MHVTLYTRRNCPLCDKAKAALAKSRIAFEEVDVDYDVELLRLYDHEVPVIRIGESKEAWRVAQGHHLERELRFPDFASALAFTNKVGAIAEELDHHPDIELAWGRVLIKTWSHDVDAITNRDLALAARIDGG